MLESTGIQLLVVHGRTRDQKAQSTGLADWDQIRAVKNALSIPVIANGNIQFFEDIDKCIHFTGVDGVMSAEGNLHNPAIFSPIKLTVYDAAKEYLQICEVHETDRSSIRGHIFKLLQFALVTHNSYQSCISSAFKLEEFFTLVESIRSVCQRECQTSTWDPKAEAASIREPHWICQPYERKALEFVREENQKDDLHLNISAKRLERKNRKRGVKEARVKAAKCGKLDFSKGSLRKLCVICVSNNKSLECQSSTNEILVSPPLFSITLTKTAGAYSSCRKKLG
ncbi:tRNA-dihydrouridine(16/17) synthase [NAD(P)(+)]-like protein [Cichlidogyrus casuarinus]|uniref:tRNA-dihydrouridine(16/17) synthase [NAD(P)(+)]-like protein n=1 Tax=Cichlidogyrus casuarinus TaxID=1844966 RepID=A0ABD2QGR8_9PLAT